MPKSAPYKKILIANRGEIACRVIRTCQEMGITSIAIYSEADAKAKHVQLADEAYCIGPAIASESYLNIDKLLAVAKESQAEAIHPGYGFLSENADFTRRCREAKIDFIGPDADVMVLMGDKIAAKTTVEKAGVPTVPGYFDVNKQDDQHLISEALKIGFPLLVKASAGGGGKGMRVVHHQDELESALSSARREALNAFGDDTIFLEKFFTKVRHIEFQILGDSHGNIVHVYERECSIQRRHQKVIEETPSVALNPELRQAMAKVAVQAAKSVNYVNAGTIEMLLDNEDNFYFLEMNTRLQVEHPVTELITGIDLVREQILVASGQALSFKQEDIQARGHAIESRIYAEDSRINFLPSTGKILALKEPQGAGIRLDSCLYLGMEVTPFYDPMLAKLITYAATREEAIAKMITALKSYTILGIQTNIGFLLNVLQHPGFESGETHTGFLDDHINELGLPDEPPLPVLLAAGLYEDKPGAVNTGSSSDGDIYSPWQQLGKWEL